LAYLPVKATMGQQVLLVPLVSKGKLAPQVLTVQMVLME
jgi:hypothetical protein